MGNYLSLNFGVSSLANVRGLLKRKRDDEDNCLNFPDEETIMKRMSTPKRRKLSNTTKYIHQNLYLDGHFSDITIIALEKEWKLHKLYLSQSPYFSSMFHGGWKESTKDCITLELLDENISLDALDTVFGSFYLDEVTLKPIEVIPILAAATMFQMDNLIEQCSSVMKESLNITNVADYYYTSERYGLSDLKKASFKWLCKNLLINVKEKPQSLKKITLSLMQALISTSKFFVIQTEFCVYSMLKCWLFILENSEWQGESLSDCLNDAKKFYENSTEAWLEPCYRKLWCSLLQLSNKETQEVNIDDESFHSECMRCGRIILSDKLHKWRWTGLNYYSDLIMTYSTKTIFIKKQGYPSNTLPNDIAFNLDRISSITSFYVQVTVASLDESSKHVTVEKTSTIKQINFKIGQSKELLKLKKNFTFPLIVIAKFYFKL